MDNSNISDNNLYRDLILLYCPQKVGSTSIITSIRLSASDKFHVLHTHTNKIFSSLNTNFKDLTVNDIIQNTNVINISTGNPRKIYIIDIYRTQIERNISEYFQDLTTLHFNNTPNNIINYS